MLSNKFMWYSSLGIINNVIYDLFDFQAFDLDLLLFYGNSSNSHRSIYTTLPKYVTTLHPIQKRLLKNTNFLFFFHGNSLWRFLFEQ